MLTLDRLKELLSYNPETGLWTRVIGRGGELAGSVIKTKTLGGYIQITIDRKNYSGHRLAWFYMTGEWPDRKLDHVNSVRDDNRWGNLRLASNSENGANAATKSSNTTGFKGVSLAKGGKKYRAAITKDRKVYCLGVYNTAEEAHAAYVRAAQNLHGEFARAA